MSDSTSLMIDEFKKNEYDRKTVAVANKNRSAEIEKLMLEVSPPHIVPKRKTGSEWGTRIKSLEAQVAALLDIAEQQQRRIDALEAREAIRDE